MTKTYSGTIALVGKPNAGKSTLINKLLDKRLSIVTHKAQTTRNNLLGVLTSGNYQLQFIDTPGMHSKQKRDLNRWMNRAASDAIKSADLIIFLVTIAEWSKDDQWVLEVIKKSSSPVLLCINKLDIIGSEAKLHEGIDLLRQKHEFTDVTSISAKQGIGIENIINWCQSHLPEGEHLDSLEETDRPDEFFVSEIIREQILLRCHQELPYSSYVEVDELTEKDNLLHIHANIFVENEGQKKIIIGKNGQSLKEIGKRSRVRLQKLFDMKVYLKLWVRINNNWTHKLSDDLSQDLF